MEKEPDNEDKKISQRKDFLFVREKRRKEIKMNNTTYDKQIHKKPP